MDVPIPHLHRGPHVVTAAGDDSHKTKHMILPINQRKLGREVSDVLPGLTSLSSQTRKIDETRFPYPCGAIVYVHLIPGDADDALNKWISELVESNEGASLISSEQQESKRGFVIEVEKNISTIGPKAWRIIHSHTKHGLSLSTDEAILQSWREVVERQHCKFVASAIFSDPLDHSIKHTKRQFFECNNCGTEEFEANLMQDITTSNPWLGQLDHFLFNTVHESSSTMEMQDKVKRAIRLLIDHFDLVLVDGKGHDISDALLKITGWSSSTRPRRATVSKGDERKIYSKYLVNAFVKMSTKNGDIDFIDAVNHVYLIG